MAETEGFGGPAQAALTLNREDEPEFGPGDVGESLVQIWTIYVQV